MSRFRPSYLPRIQALEYHSYSEYKTVIDSSGSPGLSRALKGDADWGFLGFVQPSEFGKINPATDNLDFSNDNLRSVISVGGTNEYGDPPWMKFMFDGKVLFVPLKPLSRSTSWNEIYDAGCVYGTGDQGILPPNGRAGHEIQITANNKVTNTSGDNLADPGDRIGWQHPDATIGVATDTLVMAGWANAANNGTFEITAIDDEEITLDTAALVNESDNLEARIWNQADEVDQDTEVTIGTHTYRVRLLRGAAADPSNYASNRGAQGADNEWVHLIMSMHAGASIGFTYSYHDSAHVQDWNIGLTDADLITHHDYGLGGYSWTQEVRGDAQSYRRLCWGASGASHVSTLNSWNAGTAYGFRPALELIP